MNRFQVEIQEKYTKLVKSATLIGFLNRLAKISKLTDSQPLDNRPLLVTFGGDQWRPIQTYSFGDSPPPVEQHLVVASESEACPFSKRRVRIPLEWFLIYYYYY